MALTRKFKETVKARAQINPDSRKVLLRKYVNANIGFGELAIEVDFPSKSLMRMLSAKGNRRASGGWGLRALLYRQKSYSIAGFYYGK